MSKRRYLTFEWEPEFDEEGNWARAVVGLNNGFFNARAFKGDYLREDMIMAMEEGTLVVEVSDGRAIIMELIPDTTPGREGCGVLEPVNGEYYAWRREAGGLLADISDLLREKEKEDDDQATEEAKGGGNTAKEQGTSNVQATEAEDRVPAPVPAEPTSDDGDRGNSDENEAGEGMPVRDEGELN